MTQVPPPVRTEGWSKEELRQELQNFYDMLSSTVSSSQDEISRLHSTLSSKEAQCEPSQCMHGWGWVHPTHACRL